MSTQAKYWRCVNSNETPLIVNAIYGCRDNPSAPSDFMVGFHGGEVSWRKDRFIPWQPQPGDWCTCGEKTFYLVERRGDNLYSDQVWRCNDGCLWQITNGTPPAVPVLHRAPANLGPKSPCKLYPDPNDHDVHVEIHRKAKSGGNPVKADKPSECTVTADLGTAPAAPEFIGTGTFIKRDTEAAADTCEYALAVLVFEHCVMIDYLTQKTKVHERLYIGADRARAGVELVEGRRYRLECQSDGARLEVVAAILPPTPDYIGASERQVKAMNDRRAKADAVAADAKLLAAMERGMQKKYMRLESGLYIAYRHDGPQYRKLTGGQK